MTQKIRYDANFLAEYVNKHNVQLLMDYTKEKIIGDSIIKGLCLTEGCSSIFEKKFVAMYQNSGAYCTKYTKINRAIKYKQNNLKKYGVEFAFQSEEFKTKSKASCLNKYGVEYSSQSKIVREKSKITCLERLWSRLYNAERKYERKK